MTQRLVALELGNTLAVGAAGGDLLLPAMARHGLGVPVVVLTTVQGERRWRETVPTARVIPTPPMLSETPTAALAVARQYLRRARWATATLRRILSPGDTLYSSTETYPDVVPAAATSRTFPWIARVHHAVAPPQRRRGAMAVNAAAWFLQRWLLGRMRERAAVTLALNPPVARWLTGRGFASSRVRVLGAGVDLDASRPAAPEPKTPVLEGVYLGRLHRAKGVFDLPAIWSAVHRIHPAARLCIIGDGSAVDTAALDADFARRGLAPHVARRGFVDERSKGRALAAARVFLFTDHEAGFGLALLEALAAGLPAVAYTHPYLPEVLRGGYRTVPVGDTGAFGNRVAALLSDQTEWGRLSREARGAASAHAWPEVARAFRSILQGLPPPPAP